MSDITINYKGSAIATMDNSGTKTLLTEGTYCEDDIEVVYVAPSGGGTDFTAEWQRPSDWLPLPNDIGTYSGVYFLFKKRSGQTTYNVRTNTNSYIEVGTTDLSGNFTALLTQASGDFDISNLQLGDYFWVRGLYLGLSYSDRPLYFHQPVLETIISNNSRQFYDGSSGTPINYETIHYIAKNYTSDYNYNLSLFQNTWCKLQCVEIYGGSWVNSNIYLPLNANKLIIDNVDIALSGNGQIYGNSNGRGYFAHNHVSYGNISLNGKTALRMNMCGAYSSEVQSVFDKLGNLSTVTSVENLLYDAFNVEEIDLDGLNLQNVTNMKSMFYGCKNLKSITWGDSDFSNVTSLYDVFNGCLSITSISVPGTIHITENNGMNRVCMNCVSLETADFSNVDFTSNVTFGSLFSSCRTLKNVTFKQNAGIANNIEISASNDLTVASMLSLFNALATVTGTKTCKVGSTNLAKLTAEQKAIATDKGWTLS